MQIFDMLLVAGRLVWTELLEELKQMAPTCSPRRLARHLCEQMDWRSPGGGRPLMTARLALQELADRGQLPLPPAGPGPQRIPRAEVLSGGAAPAPVACSLAELGDLEIVLVGQGGSALSRQWNELMREHYLGPGPLCGAQLRYVIRSARGLVAALSFSPAARRLRGRDRWLGWSEAARRENLHLAVNNSRFLIRPHIQVPNLASHLLSRVLARLADDWQERYGYRPVLAETFVERARWLRRLQALEALQPACPQTRLIGVGDREADIYEWFVWATEKPGRPGLLVRAERQRLLTQEQGPLRAHVESQPVAGQLEVKVPRRGNRPARVAVLEVRWAAVQVRPPKRKGQLPPVALWAVLAREVGAPAGTDPLEWMLLSTEPVQDFAGALEQLRRYTLRWGIEVFHRVLKSGCQIETRRLGNADRLEACLGIDLVVAWRICHLTKLGRETPSVPCTVYFEEHEWQALVAFVSRQPEPPQEPPTLREAIRMLAGLGGFLGRKGDGEPGTETLWRGLQRLDDIAEAYRVLRAAPKQDPVSSDRRYG